MNTPFPKNQASVLNAWALFDSANSAHALVIMAAIFPAYFLKVTEETIAIGNWEVAHASFYAYALSFAYLVVVILSPLLSGIADYGGRRKWFMKLFTYIGSVSCCLLFFFDGMDTLWFGTFAFIFSIIGFGGGLVFYNAYLPVIATRDKYDFLSARGFVYGYAGSVLLLLFNLYTITSPEAFGLSDGLLASRWAFLSVGIWWIGIAQIPFYKLPPDRRYHFPRKALRMGYLKIKRVFNIISRKNDLSRFLTAFFLYSIGVQTIILMAATFAESEMEFGTSELILLILLLQIIAIPGAYLFAAISKRYNNKVSLIIQLAIWTSVCILAFFVRQKIEFYIIAGLVGLVLGGIQSLSRSSYAKLIDPYKKDPTSFFSFYEVLEKTSIVLGTFWFGTLILITGSMRYSALALAIFFIAGIVILRSVQFIRPDER